MGESIKFRGERSLNFGIFWTQRQYFTLKNVPKLQYLNQTNTKKKPMPTLRAKGTNNKTTLAPHVNPKYSRKNISTLVVERWQLRNYFHTLCHRFFFTIKVYPLCCMWLCIHCFDPIRFPIGSIWTTTTQGPLSYTTNGFQMNGIEFNWWFLSDSILFLYMYFLMMFLIRHSVLFALCFIVCVWEHLGTDFYINCILLFCLFWISWFVCSVGRIENTNIVC